METLTPMFKVVGFIGAVFCRVFGASPGFSQRLEFVLFNLGYIAIFSFLASLKI